MVNSRDKGAAYERELARLFREHGYDARRGQQYSGANGDADVVGLPHIHVEAKRRENGSAAVYDWLTQAVCDAREGELPAVFHRRNHCSTIVVMRVEDWFELYKAWEVQRNER